MMNLNKYSKCSGCKALNKDAEFGCTLGFEITQEKKDGTAHAPRPVDKCYRPMTDERLAECKHKVK